MGISAVQAQHQKGKTLQHRASAHQQVKHGVVTGYVRNSEGEPVANAVVFTRKNNVAHTNAEGAFKLKVPAGQVTLYVKGNKGGDDVHTYSLYLAEGENYRLNVTLNDIVVLQGVELFGEKNKQPEKLDEITRLPLNPQENIQTITTISDKVINKQGILTIADATRNAPGVYTYATYGNQRESLGSRGFRGIPVLKNGVRVNSDFRGHGFITDMEGVESVQVLKGATAVTQGFGLDLGAAGGVVNLVTKTPKFKNSGEVSLRYGSFNTIRPTLDVNYVLDKNNTLAFRLNGAYEHSDGYRQGNTFNKYYVNPSLKWRPTKSLEVTLEMDYMDDKRTPDPGTINLSIDNTKNEILDLPKSKFLGFKDNETLTKNLTYSARAKYDLTKNLYVRVGYYASHLDLDGLGISLKQNVDRKTNEIKGSPYEVTRALTKGPRTDDNKVLQLDFVGQNFQTGIVKHLFQVGFDFKESQVKNTSFNSVMIDKINVEDDNISNTLPNGVPTFTETGRSETYAKQLGGMAQYVMQVKDYLRVFMGSRYSHYTSHDKTKGNVASGSTVNPIFGVLANPTKNIGIFASYTNISDPRSAARLDKDGNELGNSVATQWEAGFKTQWFNQRLRFNATYFNVQNKNMIMQEVTLDSNGVWQFEPYYFKGGNDTRQGIELELIGRILPNLEVMGGYSYLDAKYKNSTRFVDGSAPNNTPHNVANFWTNYTFNQGLLNGLSLGAGVYYLGDRPYNDFTRQGMQIHGINVKSTPWLNKAYTTLNAQIAYNAPKFRIQLLANNILDEIGYNAYRNVYINRIDPRNFAAKFTYKF
ncbi:TonB-dependent siderophore receptor [Ornithobacterium rhinotracheale]|uniref:TonB-dependent siderophore receptor n=1 Tax=Ornithobacterium rhinotracheale TaxID=28251 RepID=A0A410JPT6_ORNRH|nr:TonB-dependent receptor [Ornithobacterium rhinotracheale]QAR30136.1 TonB-dependent siderophore receptor [Ornithobacterium rhinotracheale]